MATDVHKVATATFRLACPPSLPEAQIERFVAQVLSVEAFEGYLADPTTRVWVGRAENGAELAGYTMVFFREPSDPAVAAVVNQRPSAELSKCYVKEQYHGRGLANALLQTAVDAAIKAGVASIWLGVNQDNIRAQRFYAKFGFKRIGTRQFTVGERVMEDYVMGRMMD